MSSKRQRADDVGPSSKKVRFGGSSDLDNGETELEFELEKAKGRTGKRSLKLGGYDDASSDEELPTTSNGKGKAVEEDDLDMFGDDPVVTEVDKGKQKPRMLAMHEIEGQEFNKSALEMGQDTRDEQDVDIKDTDANINVAEEDVSELREGEGKASKKQVAVEAFNMKEEMETGRFDENGNYIQNDADPDAFHDSWLSDVRKKDIEKARLAQQRKQKEDDRKAAADATSRMSKPEILKEILGLLRRGESIMEALQRYGKRLKSLGGSVSKLPAWKLKKLKKGGDKPEMSNEALDVKKKIEKLTDLADKMMAMGHFTIYDETWEEILRTLQRSGTVGTDWQPPSAADDEEDLGRKEDTYEREEEIEEPPQQTNGSTKAGVQWEYKWTGSEASEVFGPYSTEEMQAWRTAGYFTGDGGIGVIVRKAGRDSDFVPISRIDFGI